MNVDVIENTKRYADMYLSQGISIVKIPYGQKKAQKSWEKYEEKLPTQNEIDAWFSRNKRNIAIICGQVSDLVVLDFDSSESYSACMNKELEEKLLVSITHSGRRHVYIRTNGKVPSEKIHKWNFEVHSDGTYVIAPPSLHPTQSNYIFERDFEDVKDYFENEYLDVDYVNELIRKFKDTLLKHYGDKPKKESNVSEDVHSSSEDFPTTCPCFEGVYNFGSPKGERDESGIRMASYMKKKRLKRDIILEKMMDWNERNYEMIDGNKVPAPLTSKEVLDKIKSADKGYDYSCDKLRELSCFEKYCDENSCKLFKRKEHSSYRDKIVDMTEKVIKYPGKTVYYDIYLKNPESGDVKIYTNSSRELLKPINFYDWYMTNFDECFTRVSKANWDAILNYWLKNAEVTEEENVSDEDLVVDNIIRQIRRYKFMDNINECLRSETMYRSNGGVLISNHVIKELLNKECKKFGMKIDLRKLSILMREYLAGNTKIRKVGVHSYRFWQFTPDLFVLKDVDEDSS